jgi:HEAT repeat protein
MLFHRNRVAPLIEALQSADAESRQKAYRVLQNLLDRKIHLDEARTALEAAGAEYPLQESEFDDPQRLLLQIAAKKPDPTFIPVIERDFGRYSPRAQTAALDLLVTISTPNAIQSLCALLAQAEGDASCLAALESRTEYAPLLFPTLLSLLARQENAHHHFYIATCAGGRRPKGSACGERPLCSRLLRLACQHADAPTEAAFDALDMG